VVEKAKTQIGPATPATVAAAAAGPNAGLMGIAKATPQKGSSQHTASSSASKSADTTDQIMALFVAGGIMSKEYATLSKMKPTEIAWYDKSGKQLAKKSGASMYNTEPAAHTQAAALVPPVNASFAVAAIDNYKNLKSPATLTLLANVSRKIHCLRLPVYRKAKQDNLTSTPLSSSFFSFFLCRNSRKLCLESLIAKRVQQVASQAATRAVSPSRH
jgi:hypothetical protein